MTKAKIEKSGHLRPPIVTVLGHVDHGKTTLLDSIRKTNFVQKEAGGITQSIGASVVKTREGKKITFIDTPGHAAFEKMRSRGAKLADVVVLVVAGNEGVKPQTKEALDSIKQTKTPFIVAVTKVDLPSSSVELVRNQLEKQSVSFEGRGGDALIVAVSGRTGKGIDELLEIISLVSEVNEIKGDPAGDLEAVVIETSKDKRGPIASVVVRNGTLRARDAIVAEDASCKVKGLFDYKGKSVEAVRPGEPAQVLGFSELPPVGGKVRSLSDKNQAQKEKARKKGTKVVKEGQIPVVVKAKSAGSLEALLSNIPDNIVVIGSGIGDVNVSDVFLAKSSSQARIFAFESKVSSSAAKLAETEGAKIESYEVIYEFLERLEELVKGEQKEILGKAEVLASFPYGAKKVAGCKVTSGRIASSDNLILMRADDNIGEAKVLSMKKGKQDVSVAKVGEEFGVILEPQLDFKLGDMIVSLRK